VAVYALSDLHLSLGIDKPMDIFGPLWHNYMNTISKNWLSTVSQDDLVIIGGDFSWATYLSQAKADFEFLNSLPGHKLLIKGNHDYWWESITKLQNFVSQNGFNKISFIHNSAYIHENFSISGTRLWLLPDTDGFGNEDKKIYERELIRLTLSLDKAQKLEEQNRDKTFKRIAVFHYPPISSDGKVEDRLMDILLKYHVKKCIYGHLHSGGINSAFCGVSEGIEFQLTSADYLGFSPLKLT